CRQQPAREVPLVEDQPLNVGLAVQPEARVPGLDAAEPEVALDRVFAACDQQVVQPWRLRAPRGDPAQVDPATARRALPAPGRLSLERNGHLDATVRFNLQLDGTRLQVGRHPQAADAPLRQRLQPDRLPDPGGRRVPDLLRGTRPGLLPARDRRVPIRVVHLDDKLVVLPRGYPGQVGAEGRVAALVPGDQATVDPHLRPVVDRSEMKLQAAGRRRRKPPPVPEPVARGPLADPGELRLRREGHQDPAIEAWLRPGAELPLAVQVHPLAPLETGPRVLGPGRILHLLTLS